MEYACQQNFVILTTDGYWNGTYANVKEIDGTTTMGNYDNADSGLSTRAIGAYDGGVTGAENTLADVAVGCALGYLVFRIPQIDWRGDHPKLGKLYDKLAARQSFIDTAPPSA